MSVSGILSSSLYNYGLQAVQQRGQQMRSEFQQLGQDLKSGNLSAAQSDFASLQQLKQGSPSSSMHTNSTMGQDFQQLAQDLKSGNTSAAQQDYAKIQQDLQSQSAQAHGHHHHHGGGGSEDANDLTQTMDDLGQALQSGNISTAQQAYSSLEQEFQMFAQSNPQLLSAAASTGDAGGISVSA